MTKEYDDLKYIKRCQGVLNIISSFPRTQDTIAILEWLIKRISEKELRELDRELRLKKHND